MPNIVETRELHQNLEPDITIDSYQNVNAADHDLILCWCYQVEIKLSILTSIETEVNPVNQGLIDSATK